MFRPHVLTCREPSNVHFSVNHAGKANTKEIMQFPYSVRVTHEVITMCGCLNIDRILSSIAIELTWTKTRHCKFEEHASGLKDYYKNQIFFKCHQHYKLHFYFSNRLTDSGGAQKHSNNPLGYLWKFVQSGCSAQNFRYYWIPIFRIHLKNICGSNFTTWLADLNKSQVQIYSATQSTHSGTNLKQYPITTPTLLS